ncbi:MAG: amidohydrolase family protein, partial [Haliscomenobacter sp.]
GMRRANMAGGENIEHGDGGTAEGFALMAEKGVAFCPTLAAGDAISQYRGWQKGKEPEPERIQQKRTSFALALQSGVRILAGGDVGVFAHGENARELQLMVEYGMSAPAVLRAVTSENARTFHLDKTLGFVRPQYIADLIAVPGNPETEISSLARVAWVMKNGVVAKDFPAKN